MTMLCPKNYGLCGADVRYNPRKLFVIMPFREEQAPQSLFHEIRDYLTNWHVEKANTDTRKPEVWCTICANIQESRAVIADLSGANPNVLLELGMVFGLGRPFILLVQDYDDLKFDTQGLLVIKYSRDSCDASKIDDVEEILGKIQQQLGEVPETTPELFEASREGRLYRRILAAKKIASDYWILSAGNWEVKEMDDTVNKVVVSLLDSHPAPKSTRKIANETNVSRRQALRIVTGKSGSKSEYFDKIEGGYRLSDRGVYWAIDEILPQLSKKS